MSTTTYKILVFQGGGDVREDLDEVGEWRRRRSDILDVREGGDTIRWSASLVALCEKLEKAGPIFFLGGGGRIFLI